MEYPSSLPNMVVAKGEIKLYKTGSQIPISHLVLVDKMENLSIRFKGEFFSKESFQLVLQILQSYIFIFQHQANYVYFSCGCSHNSDIRNHWVFDLPLIERKPTSSN